MVDVGGIADDDLILSLLLPRIPDTNPAIPPSVIRTRTRTASNSRETADATNARPETRTA